MNILTTLAQSMYYDDRYSSSSSLTDAEAFLIGITFLAIGFFIAVITYVAMSLAVMFIFKKAGIPGWIAWVPFYNNWKLLELGGQQGFWAVISIIPIVNIVAAVFIYIAMYNIGLKLEKTGAFVLLAIFLPIVWAIWLAVDKSVWNDEAGAPSLAERTPPAPATPAA